MDKERLKDALSAIEKQHGAGTVFRLGSKRTLKVDVITTGVLPIDVASGIGGMPRGRVVEVYGPESGGKTTIALQVIAQAQKMGGLAAFIDAEHALDPIYAAKLGVDTNNLIISQPDNGEQALEVADSLIKSGQFLVVVIDSVAALVPKAELEGEMGQAQMGLQARLMSQAMRKLVATTSKTGTCLIFINQVREKIGVFYGNPETTTGGRALKFYASMRLDIRRISDIKEGDKKIGFVARAKFVKNKLASPFKEVEPTLLYGEGFSPTYNLVTAAVDAGVIEKSGAWLSFGGERLGQGKDNAVEFLKANPEVFAKLDAATRAKVFAPPVAVLETDA